MNDRERRTPGSEGSILRTRKPDESQDLHRALGKLFSEVEEWHRLTADTLSIHPNSALGIADALNAPFRASHAVSYLRLTAVDHLHALRSLMKEAQAQHIFAPYSLLRASIESAASALWILADPSPRSMAVCSLRLEWANLQDRERAYETMDASDKTLALWRAEFEQVLAKNNMKKEGIKARQKSILAVIQEASSSFNLGKNPALMWQMCSGATHGRNWVTGMLTMMEATDDGVSQVISGRLTSDEQSIVLAAYAACDLVRCLFQVQALHSRPAGHSGESFVRAAPGLLVPTRGLLLPKRFGS
uniref:hypothetical protein n=1 Tax=Arthrobacter sp. TaxID=1667 RepID=UPI000EB75B67|nr:hypothetical protein [Arthrobacter sp.]AXV46578.1 hypothetical protein pA58H2_p32 [Arthrobacter sp.]